MYPNSQIVHQMPYGHVIDGPPPRHAIQLQHHPADLNVLANLFFLSFQFDTELYPFSSRNSTHK